uniref:Cytochrome p450 n=1 Tax=Epiphyas postvittana TaxID=65032 RepID=A0A0K8TV78_EPIPO
MLHTLAFLGAALLCAWALSWVYGRRARALLSGLPGYPQFPIIGNLLKVIGDNESIYQFALDLSEKIEVHQKPLQFWFGPYPVVIVSDPEDVKAVNNTFIEKPFYYSFGRIWLGNGLVTAPGSIWKRNIKKLAGTFTGSIVDGYQEVFNAQAHKLVENLKGEVGKKPFNIMHKYLAYTTLETICQTALGVARISENIVTKEYYEAFTRTLELLIRRGINILMHPDRIYRLTPAYKELVKCVAVLHNVSNTVISKRRKEFRDMKQNGTYKINEQENGKPKFRSFLDILLELSEADPTMNEEQIRAEVDTITVGGQETVATTLLFAILMVGSKPEVQKKLHAEINSIFGDSKRSVQKEDLARMPYSEALICETLRLYPPVPMVMRDADCDLKLQSCTIPKGTACAVNALGAGRSRHLWGSDALEFKPERWLQGGPAHPAAFLAFSYGKRACIGKRYAMSLLKTILAYCVRELIFVSEADKLRLKVDIALKPISGHFVEVRLRP